MPALPERAELESRMDIEDDERGYNSADEYEARDMTHAELAELVRAATVPALRARARAAISASNGSTRAAGAHAAPDPLLAAPRASIAALALGCSRAHAGGARSRV